MEECGIERRGNLAQRRDRFIDHLALAHGTSFKSPQELGERRAQVTLKRLGVVKLATQFAIFRAPLAIEVQGGRNFRDCHAGFLFQSC